MKLHKLYDTKATELVEGAIGLNVAFTKYKPSRYVSTIAGLFLLLCERFRLEPRRVLEVTERVLRNSTNTSPREMRAVRNYLKEEIKDE